MASENGKTNSMAALLEWGADVDTQVKIQNVRFFSKIHFC